MGETGQTLVMTFPGCAGEADGGLGGWWAFQVEGRWVWEVSMAWRVAGWGLSENRGARGHWEGACGERGRGTGCSGRVSSDVGSSRQWLRGDSGVTTFGSVLFTLSAMDPYSGIASSWWMQLPALVCPARVPHK